MVAASIIFISRQHQHDAFIPAGAVKQGIIFLKKLKINQSNVLFFMCVQRGNFLIFVLAFSSVWSIIYET